jgi:Coenzyme PQQ synthesis protein D (PqqD)
MAIGLSTLVKHSTDQVSCNLNGEVVVLNLKSTLYFGLDEVGACIWNSLRDPKRSSDICRIVMDRFDVKEEQCRADVLDFLGNLDKAGLIQRIP